MTTRTTLAVGLLMIVVAAAVGSLIIPRVRAQNTIPWINQDASWTANKERLQAFGERFPTSDAMFEALKQQAHGGKAPTWPQMAEPAYDWSGVYTRSKLSLHFDPDLPNTSGPVSREATPAGEAVVKAKADLQAHGGRIRPHQRLPPARGAALAHGAFPARVHRARRSRPG